MVRRRIGNNIRLLHHDWVRRADAASRPMTPRIAPSRTQRGLALTGVVVLHGLLVFAVLISRTEPVPAIVEPSIFQVASLPAEAPVKSKPPPPSLPSKVAQKAMKRVSLASPDETLADAVTGPTGECSTLGDVSNALKADPVAVAALHNAPPDTRSVAEAVVMWNAGWSPASTTIDAPLGPVRAVVEQTLHAANQACLDEVVTGPRLIPIPDGSGTMFVVLGSGSWTWRQLLAPPEPTQELNFEGLWPSFWALNGTAGAH